MAEQYLSRLREIRTNGGLEAAAKLGQHIQARTCRASAQSDKMKVRR